MPSDKDLERLVTQYAGLISDAIRRVCARHFDFLVPDVRQEVYVALWRQLEAGNNPDREASYVYKVALTTALREVRRVKREREIAAENALLSEGQAHDNGPEEDTDKAARLEAALGELEGRQQRAVRAYLTGFNHREIAELLDITESQARHAIYRGIEKLHARTALRKQDRNDE